MHSLRRKLIKFIFAPRFSRFDMFAILGVVYFVVNKETDTALIISIIAILLSVFFERQIEANKPIESKLNPDKDASL